MPQKTSTADLPTIGSATHHSLSLSSSSSSVQSFDLSNSVNHEKCNYNLVDPRAYNETKMGRFVAHFGIASNRTENSFFKQFFLFSFIQS